MVNLRFPSTVGKRIPPNSPVFHQGRESKCLVRHLLRQSIPSGIPRTTNRHGKAF